MKMKLKKGFTLVEIMIVVAIIAILAAVAIPNFVRYRKTSMRNACISNLKEIQMACEQWRMNNSTGGNPGLTDLYKSDGTGYLKTNPVCPAGGTYATPNDDTSNPTCTGADGATGEYEHKLP